MKDKSLAFLALLLLLAGLTAGASTAPVAAAVPDAPTGLTGAETDSGATLRWNTSANVGGYNVYRDNAYLTTVSEPVFVDEVGPGSYRYYVTAFDVAKVNFSARSNEFEVTVGGNGGDKPVAPVPELAPPAGLRGRANDEVVALNWSLSDGAGGYNVYRDNVYLTTVSGPPFAETIGAGSYHYYVIAFDMAKVNFSARSNEIEVTVTPAPEHPDKPDAVVSLGDSFISGEAGRWKGNSTDFFGSRDSTDRAHRRNSIGLSYYDDARVYVDGTDGRRGCHRSDVAPIISAQISGVTPVNLACSAAFAENIHLRNQVNGSTQPIQTDRLAELTETHDIELVVLSIGGNDMDFGGIIRSCLARFVGGQNICRNSSQRAFDDRLANVMTKVDAAIDGIQATLAANGDRQYRLVLQSYPSMLPRGDDFRMSQSRISRLAGGCSFYDKDATWARDEFVPQFDEALAKVAADNGIEFLSLKDAFDGKEVCAKTVRQASERDRNKPEAHEWVRFIAEAQGTFEEALHPNMYGQQAMGRCIQLLWENPVSPSHSCTNTGAGPRDMLLASRG